MMYMKELENKNELEKIVRKCVEDIKEEIIQLKGESRVALKGRSSEDFGKDQRERLIERLLNNEKVLTLIYDKTFYPDSKNLDVNILDEYSRRENISELE